MGIRLDRHDRVAVIILDDPKIRNALTVENRVSLRDTLAPLATDDRVDVVIIAGAEENFCAGGDVRTMGETDPARIRERMECVAKTAEAVASFPKPVIAAVAGHAAGAGVSLACLCDMVIAEETATFTFSFLKLGLGPDWGLTWSLPRRVGAAQAKRLILSRAAIGAPEAHRLGLVDVVLSTEDACRTAMNLAKDLSGGPRESIAAVKTMLSDLDGLRAALKRETAMQLERFPHWEHQEGARAFREKRHADYRLARTASV
jgi:2-(1,2-epoxy-1,2-dihydrophenyl)acetyl-CoA isomerase